MHEIHLEHTTDTGHRIVGHKGKCARLHGHTYRWLVTLRSSKLVAPGFVVDFGDVKDVLNEWDHRVLLWEKDPIVISAAPPILQLDFSASSDEMLRIRETFQAAMKAKKPMVLPKGVTYTADGGDPGVVRVPFNPTAENMADHMVRRLGPLLTAPCEVEIVVFETPKSSARATWSKL